ncbi:MAG: PEP-CTERM sorting domain-containing protein [Fimbriimonadales bacterium]
MAIQSLWESAKTAESLDGHTPCNPTPPTPCCGPVPEPSVATALGFACVSLVFRRRRRLQSQAQ